MDNLLGRTVSEVLQALKKPPQRKEYSHPDPDLSLMIKTRQV
jgi:hypothetical protein